MIELWKEIRVCLLYINEFSYFIFWIGQIYYRFMPWELWLGRNRFLNTCLLKTSLLRRKSNLGHGVVLSLHKFFPRDYYGCVLKWVPISRLNVTDNQSRVTIHRFSRANQHQWRNLMDRLLGAATCQSNFSINVDFCRNFSNGDSRLVIGDV